MRHNPEERGRHDRLLNLLLQTTQRPKHVDRQSPRQTRLRMESMLARPKVSTPSVFRGRFRYPVDSIVQGGVMAQVQLRLSRETLEKIDRWVLKGKFKSRSDAVTTIIGLYEEQERTREYLKMLMKRSEEARKHPESLVSLEEL